jgi:hypothetical protein
VRVDERDVIYIRYLSGKNYLNMAGRGNPGYGKSIAVRQGVEKLTPRYFELLEVMINGEDKDDRKFSMTELGKLMGKMLPTEITGEGGNALMITWQNPPSLQSNTAQENGNNDSTAPLKDGLSSSSTGAQERLQQSSTTSNETQSLPQAPDSLS